MQQQRQDSNTRWTFLGTAIPKSEIVYFCQMFLVYLIVVTSIVNLSMNSGKTELWVSLLSSAIGYALPSPSLNKQQHECVILPLLPCSSMCISGQTGSGKTRFVYRLLSDVTKMYREDPPDRIVYCYGIHQPLFDDMEVEIPNLEMKHGLPTPEEIEEFTKDRKHRLIIIDDLSHQLLNNQEMELLFTQGCHHR